MQNIRRRDDAIQSHARESKNFFGDEKNVLNEIGMSRNEHGGYLWSTLSVANFSNSTIGRMDFTDGGPDPLERSWS
jgi:hypothetical protein